MDARFSMAFLLYSCVTYFLTESINALFLCSLIFGAITVGRFCIL